MTVFAVGLLHSSWRRKTPPYPGFLSKRAFKKDLFVFAVEEQGLEHKLLCLLDRRAKTAGFGSISLRERAIGHFKAQEQRLLLIQKLAIGTLTGLLQHPIFIQQNVVGLFTKAKMLFKSGFK